MSKAPVYTDDNDPEFQKLKKVVLECQPFKDGTSTLVCVNCFRLLAFPSQAHKIQCGACNAITSGVQAKCVSCAHSIRIPLGSQEVQCPKCLYSFKPMTKMRVRVPEVLAKTLPPPIALTISVHADIPCPKPEFTARTVISKPLSANIASWEMASGGYFHNVKFTKNDVKLDASKTPVELGLKHGDTILVQPSSDRATAAGAGKSHSSSSSAHDFQPAQFNQPTNCAKCHEFIWGVYKQGMKCVRCGMPVHHRCAEEASGMCDAARRQLFGIMDFGDGEDDDEDEYDDDGNKTNKGEESAAGAIIAVPIEDVQAFMAACKEDIPPECDPNAMQRLSDLAKFDDDQIANLWQKYDKDKSGVLETGEAYQFLADIVMSFGPHFDPKDAKNSEVLARLLRRLDTNEDGVVTWDEFYMFFQCQKDVAFLEQFAGTTTEFTTEQLYELWGQCDADGSGELEVDEVLRLLSNITHTDPKSLKDPKKKKNKLASFLKTGQKVTWDVFYSSFVPIIQAAVAKAKPAAAASS